MTRTCDVVIVGARVAGAATARLLAQDGLDVVVVDRATFPSDTRSTHSIATHGSLLLQRWGLWDRLVATGAPNPRVLGIRLGAIDLEVPLPDDGPGSFSPRRTVLDHALVDAARDAGAEVWEGTSVTAIERGRIETDRGEVRAPLVVGADGVRSRVAAAFGADPYDVQPSSCSGVYAYYAGTGIERNEGGFGDRVGALAFATNDGLTCVAAAVHERELPSLIAGRDAGALAILDAAAPRIADGVRRGERVTRFVVFRPVAGRYHPASGDGWALVGDAGHYLDPITGQGIANAFLSAQLLRDAVVDGDLACYGERRDDLTRRMHEVTGELSRLEWDGESIVPLFLAYREALEKTAVEVGSLA